MPRITAADFIDDEAEVGEEEELEGEEEEEEEEALSTPTPILQSFSFSSSVGRQETFWFLTTNPMKRTNFPRTVHRDLLGVVLGVNQRSFERLP
jgi:hypothetical protein